MLYNVDSHLCTCGGVYIIRNTINSYIYIGSTSKFRRRYLDHRNDLYKNKHHSVKLQQFVNTYGIDALIFEVLNIVNDSAMYLHLEQWYIDIRKPYFNIAKNVYTPTLGVSPSTATRKKIVESNYGTFVKTNALIYYNVYKLNMLGYSNDTICRMLDISKGKLSDIRSRAKGSYILKLKKFTEELVLSRLIVDGPKEINIKSTVSQFLRQFGTKENFLNNLDIALYRLSLGANFTEASTGTIFNSRVLYGIVVRGSHSHVANELLVKYKLKDSHVK